MIKIINELTVNQKNQFGIFSDQLNNLTKSNEEKFQGLISSNESILNSFKEQLSNSIKENRTELTTSLKSFEERFSQNVKEFNELQKQKFDDMTNRHQILKDEIEGKLEKIRETIEKKMDILQQENSKKLEEMRITVDEKLQITLERRLSESFKQVSDRLEQVYKGLWEMQSLAIGVGDLKKVLSKVKSKGILGEIQLGSILEDILSPEQYERDVVIKKGSENKVEYAIKLPGKDDSGQVVYLPIDSKFPLERYEALVNAYDTGNKELVDAEVKKLEKEIKSSAQEIKNKYLNPPDTTDFGILFLPTEGLYAEVVRQTALIKTLQKDYKIIVTGPSTLAAFLNSLQMGFQTLAIQKRTSEVWRVLGAVKTEFEKFEHILKNAQDKIVKASEDIDQLVGTRTRKIQSKLREVQKLPEVETKQVLDTDSDDETEEGENTE
ncbi:MAG TPA: DNA recombination protein RmuC [Candidatus Ratteibacteria bacterium]|nr:DNA recombination protein RmuC [Candidatus Ratteibacteria bacterium]